MSPQNAKEAAEMCQHPYISVVGSLMYLALTTRPDIAYAARVLARFNSNPGFTHWQAVTHVLYYLKGTVNHRLVYRPSESPEPFITYSNADHGGNLDNGRSTGGYVCSKLGGRVEDKGTRMRVRVRQGISGVRVSIATSIQECRLLTSGVWVSTATEGTKGKLLVLKDRQKLDKLRFELRERSLS
jgi:hypothetical protein